MAKTFYGYAEREAGSYVDWSQIGSDISEMLNEEVARRELLKAEINKASTEYGEVLNNAPTGQHAGATKGILNLASNAQSARLMQDRLLKSGQLKVKDYLIQRETLMNGTKGIFGVAKKFQERVASRNERMLNGDSQDLEPHLFALTEGYANFTNSDFYINPVDFQISAAKRVEKTDEQGNVYYEMSKDPNDFFTIPELNSFVSADINRFDIEAAVNAVADKMGKRIQSDYVMDEERKSFIIRTISDSGFGAFERLKEENQLSDDEIFVVNNLKKALEEEAKAALSNPYDMLSVYTNSMGQKRQFTFNGDDQVDGTVLLDKDPAGGLPRPNFENEIGSKQKEEVIDNFIERVRLRLDQSVTEAGTQIRTPKPTKDPDDKFVQRTNRKVRNSTDPLGKIIYGTDAIKAEGFQDLKQKNEKIRRMYLADTQERDPNTGDLLTDANGKVLQNWYIEVYTDNNRTDFTQAVVVEDFNNKTPMEIYEQSKFNVNLNILDPEKDDLYYDPNVAISSLNRRFEQYGQGLDKNRTRGHKEVVTYLDPSDPTKGLRETASTTTKKKVIDHTQRKGYQLTDKVGTVAEIFDEKLAENKNQIEDDPTKYINLVNVSYNEVPSGMTAEQIPFRNGVTLEPLEYDKDFEGDKVKPEGGWKKNWMGITESTPGHAVRFKIDPMYGEDVVIPLWEGIYSNQAILQYIDKTISDLMLNKSKERVTRAAVKKLIKDDYEKKVFDSYNNHLVNAGSTTADGDGAGAGAGDDTNANPGNTLFQK